MGLRCYENVNIQATNCLPQCNGVYADVFKKETFDIVNMIKNVRNIEKIYENYKQGFQNDIDYKAKLGSGKTKSSFKISVLKY